MGGTNTVYIILLENSYILLHIVNAHYIACFRICIVVINSEKLYIFVIKGENIACDFYMLKANHTANNLNRFTLL